MNTDVMFSSKTPEWETPLDFFRTLDAEFHFTVDVCATAENAKCQDYFSPEQDGLSQEWRGGYSGATRPMGARSESGCRKRRRPDQPLSCCCRHGPTQHGFTISSTERQRYVSFAAASNSEEARTALRSRQWCAFSGGVRKWLK